MRFVMFTCAVFVCAMSLGLRADESPVVSDASAVTSEEPSDFNLLSPLTQAEQDEVRGECIVVPASYAAQLVSAFTAARQYLAAVRAGGCVGTITRNDNLTWTYNPCGGG